MKGPLVGQPIARTSFRSTRYDELEHPRRPAGVVDERATEALGTRGSSCRRARGFDEVTSYSAGSSPLWNGHPGALKGDEFPCFAAYLTVTLLTVAMNGSAAVANLTGHPYALKQADTIRVPRWWRIPLGVLLGAGALGLLAGFAVPALGALAAAGLVLYFVGAFGAHLRARDYQLGGWAVFFCFAAAALVLNLAHHGS